MNVRLGPHPRPLRTQGVAAPALPEDARAGRPLLLTLLALLGVLWVASLALWIMNIGTEGAETDFGTRLTPLLTAFVGLTYGVVGTVVLYRRPGNAVGRVCVLIGILVAINTLAIEYAVYALLTDPGGPAGGRFAAWLANWSWVLYIGFMGTVLVLVYPDGKLPSPRWRPVVWVAAVGMTMAAAGFALAPGRFVSVPWASNPFGIEGFRPLSEALSLGFFLLAATMVAAAVSMVLRFRRAGWDQRQQIKWFASAVSVVAIIYVGQALWSLVTGTLGNSAGGQRLLQTAIAATFGVIALAIGVAITRYRLYDIDHLISRTVTYGLISGVLGVIYAAVAFGLGQIVPAEGDLAVAASTLTVASLFAPLRRRIQGEVDRRFNRTRYDAARTIERFHQQLRHTTDLSGLRSDLVAIAGRVMQPAHVSLWTRE